MYNVYYSVIRPLYLLQIWLKLEKKKKKSEKVGCLIYKL